MQSNFSQKIARTFVKYWLAGLISLLTAVFFIAFIKHSTQFSFLKLVFIGFFLTFASLAISMLIDSLKAKFWHHLVHYLVIVIMGLILFIFLPVDNFYNGNYVNFMVGCFIASLVLYLPFFRNQQNLDFVNYLKHLVINFFVSIVFALIIYAGFAIFYYIVGNLFAIKITELVQAYTISLVFTTIGFWIFAYLLPVEFKNIGFYEILDKIFHVLAVYVLLPFSMIYAITLYIYSLKILFTNVWPSNQVAVFIGALFVILLVIYFLIQSAESKWFTKLKYYWRFYFAICLPLLIIYFISIGIRIKQYGYTETRCLSIFLGVVCLFAGLYLVINKFVRLKYIPLAIGVLLLLLSFGPWSIFNITRHSQINRYAEFLTVNQFIIDGQVNSNKTISRFDESYRELQLKTIYLLNRYQSESIQQFFPNLNLSTNNSQSVNQILNIYLTK